jgi:hypothetical protein
MSENAIKIIKEKMTDFEKTAIMLIQNDLMNQDIQRDLNNQINCLKWVLETLETR